MAKQTSTPAKRASKPIKGTPRPKSSNAKTTPASIKKKTTSSSSSSKAKRSAGKSQSTRKSTANNRSSVSPIKELSFTLGASNEQDFKTPVKPASAAKRKAPSSTRSNRTPINKSTPSRSSTTKARPPSRSSSRPSTPSKSSQDSKMIESSLANNLLGLREYCSIM